jgi:hypothetical protein
MPLVYRVMKKDEDDLPLIEQSASGLGIRPGTDVDVDSSANVIANGKGMSVSPSWRDLPVFRIPKRLRDKAQGARGSNSVYCSRAGAGLFEPGPFTAGLELVPDSPRHGCIAPSQNMPLAEYQNDLAATRADWQIDEN